MASTITLTGLDEGHVLQRRPAGAGLKALLTGWTGPLPRATLDAGRVHLVPLGPSEAELRLEGLPPGGPYRLTLIPAEGPALTRSFWVGDLWLLAGQSNMEGCGLMADAAEPHPLVHSFSLARVWDQAREPLHLLGESPDEVHHGGQPLDRHQSQAARDRAVRGSGVGLPFGRLMADRTGVPQGLVCAAHGGTSMAQWSPGQPLYASMLTSLKAVNQPLAGVLWYQGCSDTNTAADARAYTDRTVALVETLRADLGQPDLPWLMVQIATEVGRGWLTDAWHAVQEQQRLLPRRLAGVDVVAAADLEHDDWIHLSGRAFPRLARRLAVLAGRLVFGTPRSRPAPQPVRVRFESDDTSPSLVLDVEPAEGAWSSEGLPRGFTLVDEAGRERPLVYQVRFEGSSIRLRLTDDDLMGLALCHGVGAQPQVNTVDARDLPLPVFGPLAIGGLPPLSPWFRTWTVGPLVHLPLGALGPEFWADTPGWTERVLEGWNVVNFHDEWGHGSFRQVGRTTLTLDRARRWEVLVNGDGPLRVWCGDELVIDDPRPVGDLGTVRTSGPRTGGPGPVTFTVAQDNRGGRAYGFALRLRWLD